MINRFLLTALLLCLALPVWAQGVLIVETNQPEGLVYVDGTLLGEAQASPFRLAPGAHRVTLAEPDGEAWNRLSVSDSVQVQAGDTLTVALRVPYRLRVESMPFGAEVVVEGEPVGTTPYVYTSDTLPGEVLIRKAGYGESRFTPTAEAVQQHTALLRPIADARGREVAQVSYANAPRHNYWVDYAIGGLALAAGVTAAYLKTEADRLDDRRRDVESPDFNSPQLASDIRTLDTYSTVALGAMQVGVVTLGVRFVLR